MAGVRLNVRLDRHDQVARGFARLLAAGERPQPALKNIGVAALQSTQRRFAQQIDPSGKPWKPLNPSYAAGKKGGKILQELGMRGGLLGSINWRLSGLKVLIGTNKIYAAMHQFGGTIPAQHGPFLRFMMGNHMVAVREVTIPARPFLGVSDRDLADFTEILADHLAAATRG